MIPEAGVRLASWCSPGRELPESGFEAAFDLDAVRRAEGSLQVRNFRPGDRFRPLGMAGHKKLKDLFIDRRRSPAPGAAPCRSCWPGRRYCGFRAAPAAISPGSSPTPEAVWRVKLS